MKKKEREVPILRFIGAIGYKWIIELERWVEWKIRRM